VKRTGDDWEFTRMLLTEAGVAVVPGSAFGPNGKGHVRLCFGRSAEDVELACSRIDDWLRTQQRLFSAVQLAEVMAGYEAGKTNWY
jgi:aspartate/methionine/tyrosine aminotransferase